MVKIKGREIINKENKFNLIQDFPLQKKKKNQNILIEAPLNTNQYLIQEEKKVENKNIQNHEIFGSMIGKIS